MAELFRALVLQFEGPGFKAATLSLAGFVSRSVGSPLFKSSVTLCRLPTGLLLQVGIFRFMLRFSI